MDTDPQMERVLSGRLGNVLVGADTSSFESLARKLFVFVGDKVSAEGEVVDGSTLSAQVENPDLILTSARVEGLNRAGGPWNQGHPGCIETLDMACSCSTGSSELDDVPSWCLQGELSQLGPSKTGATNPSIPSGVMARNLAKSHSQYAW